MKLWKRFLTIFLCVALAVNFTLSMPSAALANSGASPTADLHGLPKVDSAVILKILEIAKENADPLSGRACNAYYDAINDIDDSTRDAIRSSSATAFEIAWAMLMTYYAGAGALTGHAAVAAIISKMGLGNITTTIAHMMGRNVFGAAATAVVTSTVGGPMVMAALLAGGVGLTTYEVYKLGQFAASHFAEWMQVYCLVSEIRGR